MHSSCVANPDFVAPEDFAFLPNLQEVPINLKGPTEIPYKTRCNYTKEDYEYKDFLPYYTLISEPPLSPTNTSMSHRAPTRRRRRSL